MKQMIFRALALLLTAMLLLSTVVSASGFGEEIMGVEIPDTWAHDALAFAVKEGILSGKAGLGLCPTDKATRAEMAAMIVRVIGAKPQNTPIEFADCPKNAWYYNSMSAAVGMGIIYGTSEKTLSPLDNTTREQAFTIIARTFCITGGNTDVLKSYNDGNAVSSFARDAMATMIYAGYLRGSNGKLEPKKDITRQELAQVLYEIFDDICRGEDELCSSYNNLLYDGRSAFPEGTIIHGDLVIACDAAKTICLDGVKVLGRLIVLGSCTITGGTIDRIEALSDCTLAGDVSTLEIAREGICVDLEGTAETTMMSARHSALVGTGSAGKVIVYGVGSTVSCPYDSCEERIDAGLDGVTLTQTTFPTATFMQQTVQVSVRFDNVDNEHLYGVSGEGRICTLDWFFNGSIAVSQKFCLMPKSVQTASIKVPFTPQMASSFPASVRLSYGSETKTIPIEIKVQAVNVAACNTARDIPTIHVLATVTYNCKTADGRSLKRGDTVYYIRNGDTIQIPGTSRYTTVPADAIRIIDKTYYNSSIVYSQEVAEAFVNVIHDYSSRSKYLIWCNLYTQRVYIFKGEKGKWALVMQGPCASGKNTTPTRPGVYSIVYKAPKLDYTTYYAGWFSAFDGDIGFHSRLKYTSNNSWYDSRIGYPVSHGCVRLMDDMAKYIYSTCSYNTTVVIW